MEPFGGCQHFVVGNQLQIVGRCTEKKENEKGIEVWLCSSGLEQLRFINTTTSECRAWRGLSSKKKSKSNKRSIHTATEGEGGGEGGREGEGGGHWTESMVRGIGTIIMSRMRRRGSPRTRYGHPRLLRLPPHRSSK